MRRASPSPAGGTRRTVEATLGKESPVGFADDAKQTADAVGDKIQDTWEDTTDRIGDKFDEMKAEGEVKKAEAERDSVKARNDFKEDMRDST